MLKDILNWEIIMEQPRSAGGHQEIMDNLFIDAKVLAKHVDNDYQGELGYVYQLNDERVVITNDYFGSCSGCDSYEDATDEVLKNLCIQLANNSRIFDNIPEAMNFLRSVKQDHAIYYDMRNVVAPLISELYKNRVVKIDEVLND